MSSRTHLDRLQDFAEEAGAPRELTVSTSRPRWRGGGINGDTSYGATDELGCKAVENLLAVKNLHATILHPMGLDPNWLSYFFGGLNQKLVGVEEVEPIHEILA